MGYVRRPEPIDPTPLGSPPYEPVPPEVEKAIRLGYLAQTDIPGSPPTVPLGTVSPEVSSGTIPKAEPLVCDAWLPLGLELGLCSTSYGAYVVELERQAVTRAYRASPHLHLSLQPGPLFYRVELGEHTVSVRKRSAHAALQLLGLAKLGYPATAVRRPSRWFSTSLEFEAALLGASLQPGELPLAFFPLNLLVQVPRHTRVSASGRAYLLLTDSRLALVASTIVGDRYVEPLHPTDLRLRDDGRVQAGQHIWKEPRAQRVATIIHCVRRAGNERILEVARSVYTARTETRTADGPTAADQSARDARWVLELLDHVNAGGDVSQAFRILHACIRHTPTGSATQTPLWLLNPSPPWATEPCESNVAELWESFCFDVGLGRWLLEELERRASWHTAAIELSHAVWRRRLASSPSPVARLEADLDHAEYCMRLGVPERVAPLLVDTRRLFPPLSLGDLNLPSFAPPSPYREVRKRLERAMIQLREGNPKSQTAARLRLVWLDPLNPEVLAEATLCPAPIGERAKLAASLLRGPFARSSFGTNPPPSSPQAARTLDESRIEDQLRHPLSTDKPGLIDRFKSAVAQIRTPDFATLKLYCERVVQGDSPLLTVVDEAATLLGLGHVDVYISRGHDDVGVRAFRERNIVLLLGGQHVEEESRHYLSPTELRFCIASELGHIRFGHRRVSPQDVVRGALQKGKQGVDVALSVLPVLGGLRLTNRLGMVTAKLSLPQINKAMRTARTLSQAVDSAMPSKQAHMDMSQANEELLEAHRLAQLSADRAGLVCCGDLAAAVLSLLKGRTDYVRVAAGVNEQGLLRAMEQQEPSNALAFADLKLRVGSLISFYISDEYEQLRRLAYPAIAPRIDFGS